MNEENNKIIFDDEPASDNSTENIETIKNEEVYHSSSDGDSDRKRTHDEKYYYMHYHSSNPLKNTYIYRLYRWKMRGRKKVFKRGRLYSILIFALILVVLYFVWYYLLR